MFGVYSSICCKHLILSKGLYNNLFTGGPWQARRHYQGPAGACVFWKINNTGMSKKLVVSFTNAIVISVFYFHFNNMTI